MRMVCSVVFCALGVASILYGALILVPPIGMAIGQAVVEVKDAYLKYQADNPMATGFWLIIAGLFVGAIGWSLFPSKKKEGENSAESLA